MNSLNCCWYLLCLSCSQHCIQRADWKSLWRDYSFKTSYVWSFCGHWVRIFTWLCSRPVGRLSIVGRLYEPVSWGGLYKPVLLWGGYCGEALVSAVWAGIGGISSFSRSNFCSHHRQSMQDYPEIFCASTTCVEVQLFGDQATTYHLKYQH